MKNEWTPYLERKAQSNASEQRGKLIMFRNAEQQLQASRIVKVCRKEKVARDVKRLRDEMSDLVRECAPSSSVLSVAFAVVEKQAQLIGLLNEEGGK